MSLHDDAGSVPRSKFGLALAGGVLEGGFYEVGVLCALEDAVEGLDFTRADVYVGVSSGAVITSMLANGVTPRTLSRAILSLSPQPVLHPHPNLPLTPPRPPAPPPARPPPPAARARPQPRPQHPLPPRGARVRAARGQGAAPAGPLDP